jgi:hypothetical protein
LAHLGEELTELAIPPLDLATCPVPDILQSREMAVIAILEDAVLLIVDILAVGGYPQISIVAHDSILFLVKIDSWFKAYV